jgi:hypothetical protein
MDDFLRRQLLKNTFIKKTAISQPYYLILHLTGAPLLTGTPLKIK